MVMLLTISGFVIILFARTCYVSLPVGFATCHLVIFTGKHTKQFFKTCTCFWEKCFIMVVELRFFYTINFPTSAPRIRRYQQVPVDGA